MKMAPHTHHPKSLEQGFQVSMIEQVKFYFTPMFPVAREASDIIESRLPLFSNGYGEGVEMVKTMNYGDSVYKILGSLSTNCQVLQNDSFPEAWSRLSGARVKKK